MGQVISGKRCWSDGTPVAGQQHEYDYDDIGNRQSNRDGGDAQSDGLRAANYTVNALNQYTARDVPGAVDVTGIARADATVTVNGAAVTRQGECFWYDDQGRRVSKVVSNWTGSAWAFMSERRFVRDGWPASRSSESAGWNLVAESAAYLAVARTYLWGRT